MRTPPRLLTAALLVALVVPTASAAPIKPGTACSPRWKTSGTSLFCAANTGRTAKKLPLIWKRDADCVAVIRSYNKSKSQFDTATAQLADITKKIQALPADKQALLMPNAQALQNTLNIARPQLDSTRSQIAMICG